MSSHNNWNEFLASMKEKCSRVEYHNWLAPIDFVEASEEGITLQVPNVFVQEYLIDNYKQELAKFFPSNKKGDPLITFLLGESKREPEPKKSLPPQKPSSNEPVEGMFQLNSNYTFDNFIEGPSNQFIKSAATGVASKPGKSYNPLFIYGGVGLGKTHLLHSIGHHIQSKHKKLRMHCITTEAFINELIYHLKNKSLDQMKRKYRSLDILLVDDIQFLQNRLNFEEEFCNTFEALINQNKQIVITSDKPPAELKLSERMVARMEWGLVAQVAMPDLETRVAILQHKAEKKGLRLTNNVAFYIAERISNNVRQLEGAVNRLGAYCRLMCLEATQDVVEKTLSEMFQKKAQAPVTVETILNTVSSMFNVRVSDLKGSSRAKEVAFPRQVAMYLAKELLSESLIKVASAFGGKTHSTLLHAWKKISSQIENDEALRKQIEMTRDNIKS